MAEAKSPRPKSPPRPKARRRRAAAKAVRKKAAERLKSAAAGKSSAKAGASRPRRKATIARLKQALRRDRAPKLTEEFGYKNALEVPAIDKIVLNMGVGEAVNDTKKVTLGRRRSCPDRRAEAGRHPGPQGDLDLQGAREHADRRQGDVAQDPHVRVSRSLWSRLRCRACAISAASIRSRSTGAAIIALGIKEHIVFPEIDYDKADTMLGIDVIVCTTAKTDEEARALLRRSTSRSGSEAVRLQTRKLRGKPNGQEKCD